MKWRTIVAALVCLLFGASLVAFAQPANWSDIAGFESPLPSFWTKGNTPSGVTLSWATDQARSATHSLKIEKPATTTDSAAWVSENMADIWSQTFSKDVDILLGAWIKTQNVNTNPANDDARWFVVYTFYDSAGALLNETRLPIDQSVATSTGWVADTNQVSETILSKDAWKLIVSFVAGKNATGTVWADDFVLYGRGAWAGQDWNTSLEMPSNWYYWMPPNGGNDALLNAGFENTHLTNEAAHSGTSSMKFSMPAGRDSRDGFVSTHRMTFSDLGLPALKPGDSLRVSVWIKASGLEPDSAAAHPGTSWAVGITPQFFATVNNNAGFDGKGGDSAFVFPSVTSFDWTQYTVTFPVWPDSLSTGGNGKGPVNSVEIRLHIYNTFVGTVYFDDLTLTGVAKTSSVEPMADGLPKTYELSNNYPNPFNPSTMIQFAVPRASNVSLIIYNVLGQKVRTLVDQPHAAGRYTVSWDGRDNLGHVVGSGVYFYRLIAGETSLVKKMLMLK